MDILGTKEEQKRFEETKSHYDLASQDLQDRIQRKAGFDEADKLFLGIINEKDWPFQAVTFDPRISTALWEKTGRLIGSRPKGRLVPRENSDDLSAFINNELLNFQWEDNTRVNGESMLSKWAMMDQYVRRYGVAFGIAEWHYETKVAGKSREVVFDGPDFKVINPRDCLPNPSFPVIKHWFQYREWMTLNELQRINNISKGGEIYKNLSLLGDSIKQGEKGKGQRRTEYIVKSKSLRGLEDYLGRDEYNKIIEVVHEWKPDRLVSIAPRYGVVLRDEPNPYKHGQIPVISMRYYSLGDDMYGFSEIERVYKLQKAINALVCQYLDTVTTELYPPLAIDVTRVRLHTIEFGQNKKWLVTGDPNTAVQRIQTSTAATTSFQAAYSLLLSSLQNALGETSAAVSNLQPFTTEKTATEIRDLAMTRSISDNFNQVFLAEALKRQILLWHSMNQQFLFNKAKKHKIIRVVGREALNYFQTQGLDKMHPTHEEAADSILNETQPIQGPEFPVNIGEGDVIPKFEMDQSGQGGNLHVTPEDIQGTFDYIPDIETMSVPTDLMTEAKLRESVGLLTDPNILALMTSEGKRPRITDLIVKLLESTKIIKNAEQYFENVPQQSTEGGQDGGPINAPGTGSEIPGAPPALAETVGGLPGVENLSGGQNPQ